MHVAAEGSGGASFDSPITWINYGVLGLLVVGFVTGWIWTKVSVDKIIEERDRCLRERDKAWAERDEASKLLSEQFLPMAREFVTATQTVLPLLPGLPQLQQLQVLLPSLQAFLDRARSESGG